ncbi:hypothetical protein KEHDKFFH_02365 [Marinobacter maroccanus]|uniref:TIGR04255 family protein n=1 Tax=Marinobacter maroccanus TaxID=2055143 RepID=A0A2S5ZFJ6_9GAMM|nr:hypothetical protein KEHDKFFH_02365 [Marinobacter maroccanus]
MENVHFDRNASHSLSVVAVALVFREELGKEELKRLQNLNEVMKDLFPKAHKKESFNFSINESSPPTASPKFAGWTLDLPSPDEPSLIDWQLDIEPGKCGIRTLAYTGWSDFIEKALQYLSALFERADIQNVAFDELGVQFVDRFYWNLSDEDYSLSKFFKPESDVFSESIRKRNGPLWHIFQGWKEQVEGREFIENVNLSTNHPPETNHRTEIVHIVRCIKGLEGEGDRFDPEVVRNLSNHAHRLNKQLLEDILSEQAIERIDLRK